MPEVSVILPTHDRADLLPRAIDSAIRQTYDNFELIVVDDGSTDDTRSVVSVYDDERITYLSHERTGGPSKTRNTGIEAANGQYIAFLDSDDEFAPTFLERSVETLRNEPAHCAGTCVAYEEIKSHSGGASEYNPVPQTMSGMDALQVKITRVGGLTLRASTVSDIGRFDERLPYDEDVDYWIRLFRNGYYLRGIQDALYRYYKHGEQQTTDDGSKIVGLSRFIEKHSEVLPPRYLMKRRRQLGMAYADTGQFHDASTEFWRAIKHDPRQVSNYWYWLTGKLYPSLFHPPPAVKRIYRYVSGR